MYFSAGYLDFPEQSYAFYLTKDGDFYRSNYENEIVKVGYENSIEDLSSITSKIHSLPGSLTSLRHYDEYGCPDDPIAPLAGGSLTTIISGNQFRDGRLDIDKIKKDCVWKNLDPSTQTKINELLEYFSNARSVILKN